MRAEDTLASEGFYVATCGREPYGYLSWWKPGRTGHTTDLEQAGVFSAEEIAAIDFESLIGPQNQTGQSVPVPVWFIPQLQVRRMVDLSDRRNRISLDPNTLRAALEKAPSAGNMSKLTWPAIGSLWKHTNGHVYTVLLHANVDSTKAKFIPTVVYQNDEGTIYSRPLELWDGSGMSSVVSAPFEAKTV
jgi:hypothetical protein